MTEYIERGKLKAHYSWLGRDATLTPRDFDDIIDAQPAADVEPVVHGEWVRKNNELYCSVCGEEALMDEVYYESKRCPECGAHMVVPRADVYGCAENGALLTNVHIESCPKCGRRGEVSRYGERGMYCVMCFTRTQLCDNTEIVHAYTKIGAILRWNRWARRERRRTRERTCEHENY